MQVRSMVYEARGDHNYLPPSVIVDALSGPNVLDYKITTRGVVNLRIRKLEVIYKIEEEESRAEDRPT